jgi:hypothetical protein
MRPGLLNLGFVCGCAAAVLFILVKAAKYGGDAAERELPIYVALLLACGLAGSLIWRLVCFILRKTVEPPTKRSKRDNAGDVS